MRRTPPAGADPEALKARFNLAKQALDGKEYGRAYSLAKDVGTLLEKDNPIGQSATKLMEQVQEAAKKWLEEAQEAIKAKDYDKACRILAEITVRLEGTPVAADASKEVARLLGDRELKPKIRKALDNAKGLVLNDQAAMQESAQRFVDAVRIYRETANTYPDSDAAAAAEKAIERISVDPKTKQAIAAMRTEDEADRWLDLGDRLAKVKLYAKAREYYGNILEKHPDSRAASKAKDRLAKLPPDEPGEKPDESPSAEQPEKTSGKG
jgi:tetratricopeptide (TPR) repeat protein